MRRPNPIWTVAPQINAKFFLSARQKHQDNFCIIQKKFLIKGSSAELQMDAIWGITYANFYDAEADITFNFAPMSTRELFGDVLQVQDCTLAYGQEYFLGTIHRKKK
jgi:hypothetical protein